MAYFLNRNTLQYVHRGNTFEYPEPDWIRLPDMSFVDGVPEKYWKMVGDVPKEMTAGEKVVVDQVVNKKQKLMALNATDGIISREFEDLYDAIMVAVPTLDIAVQTLNKINDKKTKRTAYNNA